uniref:Uncharacterized protein n=1 Tax=Rhipicephalus appendiculatus TaxID=34631 RepID=A0A131YCR6_RHIAP
MSSRCFIIYVLLSFSAALTSGLLWRGLRPKHTVEPLCEKTYCPIGNQLSCVITGGEVYTECINQWWSCGGHWFSKCWARRRFPSCRLTRFGCACRC